MNQIQKKTLNKLLDSYEQSLTFQGKNKVRQSFSVEVVKLFPRYEDDAEYDFFTEVNEALAELEEQELIFLKKERNGVAKAAELNLEQLERCYEVLARTSRREEQEWLASTLNECGKSVRTAEGDRRYVPLLAYLSAQREKLEKNRNVEYYEESHADYEALLKLTKAVLENEEEIFIRNFSIRLFGDSKRVEQLQAKVQSLLFQYGEFEEKDAVLEECGIVHTPTYVMVKGNGSIRLGQQSIDLTQVRGDIALSTASLKDLTQVTVFGERVVTVENLTSFHDYSCAQDFVVYLGGFHNRVKREFLSFLYARNSEKEYRHFGDIDAGGFYILEHLKRKTGIPFRSLYMDVETLSQYMESTKELSMNDRRRLTQLREELERQEMAGILTEDYRSTLRFMLEKNCKLEQEAISIT